MLFCLAMPEINYFFFIQSFKDLDYVVKDKVLLETLLDIECYEVADRGYFYNGKFK